MREHRQECWPRLYLCTHTHTLIIYECTTSPVWWERKELIMLAPHYKLIHCTWKKEGGDFWAYIQFCEAINEETLNFYKARKTETEFNEHCCLLPVSIWKNVCLWSEASSIQCDSPQRELKEANSSLFPVPQSYSEDEGSVCVCVYMCGCLFCLSASRAVLPHT